MEDKKSKLNWCLKRSSMYFFSCSLISWIYSLNSSSHVPSGSFYWFYFFEMEEQNSSLKAACYVSTGKALLKPTLHNIVPK